MKTVQCLTETRNRRATGSKGGGMPYVNIKVTREGVTAEQKEQLIQGATRILAEVLGKNPKTTVVVIEEIETDNWGVAGESVTRRRRRGE